MITLLDEEPIIYDTGPPASDERSKKRTFSAELEKSKLMKSKTEIATAPSRMSGSCDESVTAVELDVSTFAKVIDYEVSHKNASFSPPVTSFSGFSMKGYFPNSAKKENQDSLLMRQDPRTGALLLACLDGHGLYGDKISQYFTANIDAMLFQHPLFVADVKVAILETIGSIEEELFRSNARAGEYSGTTMTMAVMQGRRITTANIGDSRIVLIRRQANVLINSRKSTASFSSSEEPLTDSSSTSSSTLSPADSGLTNMQVDLTVCDCKDKEATFHFPFPLTVDHKPDVAEERDRILSTGARVFCVPIGDGQFGPARVWLRDINIPGLAMSRSLGDFVVHLHCGVISTPKFMEYDLDDEGDVAVVLATDGLWDAMTNEEVASVCGLRSKASDSVVALVTEAHRRWIVNERMMDDTTVCVVTLNTKTTDAS